MEQKLIWGVIVLLILVLVIAIPKWGKKAETVITEEVNKAEQEETKLKAEASSILSGVETQIKNI